MSRRWREFGVLVALGVSPGNTSLAQSTPEALPPVTVQAPKPSPRPHSPPKRASRKPPSAAAPRATVANLAPQPPSFGSGVPNAGSGPSGPPNMASQSTVSGEELNDPRHHAVLLEAPTVQHDASPCDVMDPADRQTRCAPEFLNEGLGGLVILADLKLPAV